MVATSSPSRLSQACMAWPVSASGSPEAKPRTVTTASRCSLPGSMRFGVRAVKGAAFYGTPPPVSVGSTTAADDQWHVGQGRLLPSTSVDQYAATMAKWFGVQGTEMGGILPNLGRFANNSAYPTDLGFMKP